MHLKSEEKINVLSVYDADKGSVYPHVIKWSGRVYKVNSVNYYHKTRVGREVIHVFHVTDGTLDFRLECSSENLHWKLLEVTDGYS